MYERNLYGNMAFMFSTCSVNPNEDQLYNCYAKLQERD